MSKKGLTGLQVFRVPQRKCNGARSCPSHANVHVRDLTPPFPRRSSRHCRSVSVGSVRRPMEARKGNGRSSVCSGRRIDRALSSSELNVHVEKDGGPEWITQVCIRCKVSLYTFSSPRSRMLSRQLTFWPPCRIAHHLGLDLPPKRPLPEDELAARLQLVSQTTRQGGWLGLNFVERRENLDPTELQGCSVSGVVIACEDRTSSSSELTAFSAEFRYLHNIGP